jgi:hypothetical protein
MKNYFGTMLNTSGVKYQQNLLHLLIPDSWFKANPNWQPPSFPPASKQAIGNRHKQSLSSMASVMLFQEYLNLL